jgi:protein tyrosine phosphatase (PTP) superfamily phosphohydrolase (DUF442 family)
MLGFRLRRRRQATKLDRVRYSDDVSLGKSPTIRDIETLARKAGFRAILNLNTEGEPGQLLSPNVEATWAHAFDLQHERVSSDVGGLRSGWVDTFLDTLRRIRKPVYVHSLHGRRAATLIIIHLGLARGLSAERAVAEAEDLGIDCEAEQFRRCVGFELEERALATLLDPAARSPDPGREADFGAEFRPLLMRIRRALGVREDGGGPASGSTLSWRAASHPFEQEAEALMAKHRLEEPLATYVRHIVREGFDVDFDLMDPTPHR